MLISKQLYMRKSLLSSEEYRGVKSQCHEIFDFRFFSCISFPQAPEYRAVSIFRKFSKILAAQGAPSVLSTPVANEKSSIRKVF
jgi:hypothetical protein